jgi:hypothetical protein
MFRQTRPEWDTPPDGDFARYVERLTAASAKPLARPQPPAPQERKVARAPVNAGASAAPPDLAQLLAPFMGVLPIVRAVLLVLALGLGAVFFVLGKGSLLAPLLLGLLWWGLGRLAAVVSELESSGAGRPLPNIAQLQERLRQLAQQHDTGNKK